ncbi:MAG: response regulator [Anaerolineae bacterium]|jgi:CheY-like chemotaxis protein
MDLGLETVRWLLAHLNDNSALSTAPLLRYLPGLEEAEPQSRADAIRAIVLDCIEFLRPPRGRSIRSPEARTHSVLWLRYVEGMTVEEVSEEIALSERQVHRELRAAEAKLAEALATHVASLASAQERPSEEDAGTGVIEVAVRPAQISLVQVLEAAVSTVRPLARTLGRDIAVRSELDDDRLFSDEGVLRQLLIQMLSLVVQCAAGDNLEVTVSGTDEHGAEIQIGPVSCAEPPKPRSVDALEQLASTLHLDLAVHTEAGVLDVVLTVPLHQPKTVLIVEDSTAAVELYRRYLEPGGAWRVVGVSEPKLAFDMARRLQPAIIVLDLLMPGTDGWTILNVLRAREETAEIPVVVCSVFQDPLLAEALGAKAHLRKPVSQVQLLSALRRWAR